MAKKKAPSGKLGSSKKTNSGLSGITSGKGRRSSGKAPSYHKAKKAAGNKRKKTEKSNNSGSVEYPEKMVRAANERLRKLEVVSKQAESSSLYQRMKGEMYERPNKGGKFFQPGANKNSLRFIGKRKFQQLTEEEQIAYLKRLTSFMQSDLTTAGGLKKVRKKLSEANKENEEARKKSFETFRNRPEIKDKYPGLTFDKYTALMEAYQNMRNVKGEHFNYEDFTLFLENVDLDKLEPYQIEEAMSFVKDDNWGELVDRGWLLEF